MKKDLCLASLLCTIYTNQARPAIPSAFTVLDSQPLPEKKDALSEEKSDCIFFILISTPPPAKGEVKKTDFHTDNYRTFLGVGQKNLGPFIPKDFIKAGTATRPGVPAAPTRAPYCLHFGWSDKGGKNNLIDAAQAFSKALAQLHRNFKKSYNCHYLVVAEGRSGLLLNYATQHPLKGEAFTIGVAIEIGTPLPPDTEKAHRDFYPNMAKIGTLYAFYSQHTYLTSNAYFPPIPRTGYPQAFVDAHKNMYNIRLLLSNNQQSLQNIFEKKDMKKSHTYFGQNLLRLCNFAKQSYHEHRDLWVNLDTKSGKNQKTLIGIVSHPTGEKDSKQVKQEHQRAGMQRDAFQKQVGSASRIEMNSGHRMRSSVRSVAHLRRSDRLTSRRIA